MARQKLVPFLARLLGATAILSVVFPMLEINVASIYFAPTLLGISDISAFFQSLDLNHVFGTLNIAPLVENVKVALPLVGEISLSEILLLLGDGTLASLTGPIGEISGDVTIFTNIQTIASALYITSFLCIIFSEKHLRLLKGILSLLFAAAFVAVCLWISQALNNLAFLQNATFREVLGISEEGFFSFGAGAYLYVAGMAGHAIMLMLRAANEKASRNAAKGGVQRGST